ncbi:hypothetical protein VIBAE_B40001 [Vibrio aestuarianus subsp. francensis]|nr:hypothetical protein VIBAE_B40001 [Vibrio aestuarianus subsp. francensis]
MGEDLLEMWRFVPLCSLKNPKAFPPLNSQFFLTPAKRPIKG